jgi:2-polyprenyl-3-methyl-5-hydroxy-6-metoxy-1,4-benzoquinol methylase
VDAVVNTRSLSTHAGQEAYSAKTSNYFAGARRDYVAELPFNRSATILEVGCGEGGTGALALAEGKCERYCGVEICGPIAEKAKARITEVVVGNVEEIALPWKQDTFDALIMSEVLEHLVDPWATLQKLRPLLKPGARVFASSPNVSHYKVIRMMLRGDWSLTDFGAMDRTHLRWFTPRAYAAMFESCGYTVSSVRELEPLRPKARVASAITFGRLRHLFVVQIDLRARL